MKVFSDKPLCFVIEQSELFEYKRMDVNFFHPKYVEVDRLLKESKYPLITLSKMTELIKDGPHQRPEYVKDGVIFLQKGDVTEGKINLDRAKRITYEFHEQNPKTQVYSGDILLRKIGVGPREAAIVPEGTRPLHIYVSLAVIRLKQEYDPNYVEIFLNSSLGRSQTERRNKGIGTPDLHLEDIRNIIVPIPPETIQKNIVKTIRNARISRKRNFEEIYNLRNKLENFFLTELGLNYPVEKEEMIYSAELNERFDPLFYHPKFQNIMDALAKGNNKLSKLNEVVEFSNLKIDPKRYPDRLFKYVQIQNVDDENNVISSYTSVIGGEAPGRARMLIKEGDILIPTLGGSLNSVAIVPKEFDSEVATNGFAVLKTNDESWRIYIFYYLTSKFAQMQISRLLRGTIMPSVSKSELGNLLIPAPDSTIINKITNRIFKVQAEVKKLQAEADSALFDGKEWVDKMILGKNHDRAIQFND